jgi:hypothetical protein
MIIPWIADVLDNNKTFMADYLMRMNGAIKINYFPAGSSILSWRPHLKARHFTLVRILNFTNLETKH